MKNRNRSGKIIYLFLLIVIISIIFFDNSGWFDKPKNVIYFLVTPVQRLVYGLSSNSAGLLENTFSFFDVRKENRELRLLNEKLLSENSGLKEVDLENKFLRKQLGSPLADDYSLRLVSVVGGGLDIGRQRLIIDKGLKDNIKTGDAVITVGNIFIGRVEKTYDNRSEAMLVNNSEIKIPVLLQESRTQGIIHGEYGTGVVLDFVPIDENIMVGENIITMTIDNIPPGLLVGEISETINPAGGLFKKAIVKPTADFKNIEKVFVISK